ncbi:hypothetical protein BO71DRAFT_143029 [Aspergillus ellipticus CBS 707.79]|uniref:Uncharacterized protein n=1 Tax=Aspergillus ellipticus CBS 707.79 TaxID=1448320 RepID=A0A319CSK7_9EURO|nr:hypothetical protein BO71DRAFT_143029 [Aspergillus ellipticus CBS 707.79]
MMTYCQLPPICRRHQSPPPRNAGFTLARSTTPYPGMRELEMPHCLGSVGLVITMLFLAVFPRWFGNKFVIQRVGQEYVRLELWKRFSSCLVPGLVYLVATCWVVVEVGWWMDESAWWF